MATGCRKSLHFFLGATAAIGIAIAIYNYAYLSILVLAVSIGYLAWLWRAQGPAKDEKPTLSYRCLSCSIVHKERACPACKSNVKQVIF